MPVVPSGHKLVSALVASDRTIDVVFLSQPVVKGAAEMLKCCARSLVTLVLALLATGILSTVCSAREYRSPDGSVTSATSNAKRPGLMTGGEPDQPLSPPPARTTNGASVPGGSSLPPGVGGGLMEALWRTGWIWASWFARAAL